MKRRPTFRDCIDWMGRYDNPAGEGYEGIDCEREVVAILRTLDAGHDARTMRVREDGRAVKWNAK